MGCMTDNAQLEKELFAFTPLEEKYRSYYRETGVLYPTERFREDVDTRELEKHPVFASGATGIGSSAGVIELSEHVFRDVEDVSIAKHPRYNPEFVHEHRFFEMVYVLSGSCSQTILSPMGAESISCNRGDLLILPPCIPHSIVAKDDDSIALNILIRKSSFDKAFLHNLPTTTLLADFFTSILYSPGQANYVLFQTGGSPQIRSLIFDIFREYRDAKPYFNVAMNLQLAQLFVYLLRDHSETVSFSKTSPRDMDYIPIIFHFMECNYSWITVQDIADHVGFSASHLGRVFKRHTGKTVSQCLRDIRMAKAVNHLVNTANPIGEIAAMVGYPDITNFIRRFKAATGQTPKQYRLQNKEIP